MLSGIGGDDGILLAQIFFIRLGQFAQQAVADIILIHVDEADAPARDAVELGEGIDQYGVVGQHRVDRLEVLGKRSVHVVGQYDQIGVHRHDLLQAGQGVL